MTQFASWLKISELQVSSQVNKSKTEKLFDAIYKQLESRTESVEDLNLKLEECQHLIERDITLCHMPQFKTFLELKTRLENAYLEQLININHIDQLLAKI